MMWLQLNWPHALELLWAHLTLAIPAIVLSALIAIPVGRFAFRSPHIGGPLLSTATLLYAIPALPMLIIVDRKSTRLNSSHVSISYAVFCLKKKKYDVNLYINY